MCFAGMLDAKVGRLFIPEALKRLKKVGPIHGEKSSDRDWGASSETGMVDRANRRLEEVGVGM